MIAMVPPATNAGRTHQGGLNIERGPLGEVAEKLAWFAGLAGADAF